MEQIKTISPYEKNIKHSRCVGKGKYLITIVKEKAYKFFADWIYPE